MNPPGSLHPQILRQRLIIEGIYGIAAIDEAKVRAFLGSLSGHLGMTPIAAPLVFSPDEVSTLHHGVGGFQAWAESGCAFYTWRESRLFTLDVYTCKGFDPEACIAYVREALNAASLQWCEPVVSPAALPA